MSDTLGAARGIKLSMNILPKINLWSISTFYIGQHVHTFVGAADKSREFS